MDVGGGVGSVSLALTRAFKHLHVVVQDQAPVIEREAAAHWAKEDPAAIASGRVTLQAHDFLTPQPVEGAAVYLMRFIIHYWADKESIVILSHLRKVAKEQTKLILVEQLVQPLCPVNQIEEVNVPGATLRGVVVAPEPLLPTGGSPMTYLADLEMMTHLNATERTLPQFIRLGEKSGWKLERVYRPKGGAGFNQLVFGTA